MLQGQIQVTLLKILKLELSFVPNPATFFSCHTLESTLSSDKVVKFLKSVLDALNPSSNGNQL